MGIDINIILGAMDETVNQEPFKLEARQAIIERIYGNMSFEELLKVFIDDYDEYLQEYKQIHKIDELNTVQFADALHNFFKIEHRSKDGDRVYLFGYDGNSLRHSANHQDEMLEADNKKNTTTILSHTCVPLLIPRDGEKRRAICNGYAELGCIIATCYGYQCTPIAAMITNPDKEGGVEYDYSHYLFSIKSGNEEPVIVDLQQANTIHKTLKSKDEIIEEAVLHEQVMEQVHGKVSNMVLINPTLENHSSLNYFKLHRGGLGVNIVDYLVEKLLQYDTDGIAVVKPEGILPKGVERFAKIYVPKIALIEDVGTIFPGSESIGSTLEQLTKNQPYQV